MFNAATRQNFMPGPVMSYTAGQTKSSAIPKVGLLKRILLLISGTVTVVNGSGGAALGVESPWSIISRIRLVANGNTAIIDLSGYGAMIASLFSQHGFAGFGSRPIIPDTATVPGVAATVFGAANYAAAATVGDTALAFALEIPLALSDDWRDPVGLILAAAPDTQLSLDVTWCSTLYSTTPARTTPFTTTGTATVALVATATPYVEFFTIPSSAADYPALNRIHSWVETGPQPIVANGDQTVTLGRGNTLMRVVHIVHTNTAADATNVLSRSLKFNQNEIPYQVSRQLDAVLQRKRYVRDLPDGCYAWDLWNTGTPRDAINTLNLNELTSVLTVTGATIAGTSDIRTLSEQLIALTGAATGSA